MSDRGMKKWAPYRSLIEHMPELDKTIKERNKIEKPHLSEDEAEHINDVLTNYQGEILLITFFRNNVINKEEATIKKIDVSERKLVLDSRRVIRFEEIIGLEIK